MSILDNGRMYLHRSELCGEVNDYESTRVKIPVYAVLIDHVDGFVLFDTGCHPDAMKPGGRWSPNLQAASPWHFDKRDLLLNRLAEKGVQPQQIRYVVCSHLHCDHAGNLEFFSSSEIFVHSDEWHAARNEYTEGIQDGEFVRDDMQAWLERGINVHLVPSDVSFFTLLPGITVHNVGRGHSYGMLVLEVELVETGTVLLASDAAFDSNHYGHKQVAPRLSLDESGYVNGIQAIEQLEDEKRAQVWFGHDMSQFRTLQKSDAGWWY